MRKFIFVFAIFALFGAISCDDDDNSNNQNNNNQCGTETCGTNAHCDATSVSCVCDDGYTGDPLSGCTEDVCANVTCGTNAHCDGSNGECVCDTGYSGDPQTECVSALCENVTCGTNAHCDGSNGECICDDGYAGDPSTSCSPVTSCDENTCNGHGTCDDFSGTVVCTCETGYTGYFCDSCDTGYEETPPGSGNCVDNPCLPDPCYGHGACSVNNGLPQCACETGYDGGNCNRCAEGYIANPAHPDECIDDPCLPDPCNGHGSCTIDASAQAVCGCEAGYTGTNCDTCETGYYEFPAGSGTCADDPCLPDPCNGNGTCDNSTGSAVCSCDDNHAGEYCDISYIPVEGSLAITEIMLDPEVVADADGQYFEIYNTSDSTVQLANITFTVDSNTFTLPASSYLLSPHSYITIGVNDDTSTNGGIDIDVLFDTMVLTTTSTIQITLDSTVIDEVTLDDTWNYVAGRALNLSPAALSDAANLNDSKLHWCFAQTQIPSSTDYGTPGSENSECSIDWCNIQYPDPASIEVVAGNTTENIYGQVYVAGLTNVTNETPFIKAQVGFGTTGSTPDSSWTWEDASYNSSYSGDPNNEEFMGNLTPSSGGVYDYVYRMSLDGGLNWTTCLTGDSLRGILTVTVVDLTGWKVELYQNGGLKSTYDLSTYPHNSYIVLTRNSIDIAAWSTTFDPPLDATETANITAFWESSPEWQVNTTDDEVRLVDASDTVVDSTFSPNDSIKRRQTDGSYSNDTTTAGAQNAPTSISGYTAPIYIYELGEASSSIRLTVYSGNYVILYIP